MFINGAPDPCLDDPDNYIEGYYFMRGMDGCGRARLNPLTGQPTLFCYTGDACNRMGWFDSASHDVRLLMGSGPIVMNSLDTQIILLAGVVGYGSNNFLNVCNMFDASESARRYYYDNFNYSVSGQVRYRDNNQPVRSGYVKALKYDVNLGNIIAIDSAAIDTSGNYTLKRCPIDSLDIMAYQNSEEDFVPTYYVSTIDWRNAVKVYPDGNLQNINILVYRIQTGPELDPRSRIGGRVFNLNEQGLKDAIVYAKRGSSFLSYGISTSTGNYVINSLEFGSYDILVNRMGYCGASSTIILGPNNIDTLNFRLCRVLIGIEKNGEIIPLSFKLYQNYPNPFNPKTRIEFDIPVNSMVTLVVYDLLGREVTKLLDDDFNLSGSYSVELDASVFASGVYFYRLVARHAGLMTGDFTETKKMVLIK